MTGMRLATALLAVLTLGAAPAPPAWDPLAFFTGRTHSEGQVRPIMGSDRRLVVNGVGRRLPGGDLLLFQTIRQGDDAPTTRYWRVHGGPDRWSFTGTDISGAGDGYRAGGTVVLRWTRRDGDMAVVQVLTPAGPNRVRNAMTLRRLGMTWARVDEVIVRETPPAPPPTPQRPPPRQRRR